ncbi:hypothetical protein [Butyricimonas synergistica]|uniref:hypothetical protein n=1 Tax=Butyricimonas synergistica TaxID=544644 RepID=UPI001D091B93|nr:hypothetical protein [Butyricimonas synergistica]MCG4518629.1 hypothetical protein [Butyricimonas sp. DFI.6.44]
MVVVWNCILLGDWFSRARIINLRSAMPCFILVDRNLGETSGGIGENGKKRG